MNNIGPARHDNRPLVAAFGSAKGGTGRTTLCADIARALTRYNFRVLCVDAAWACPSLNILLGCQEPTFDFDEPDRAPIGSADSHIAEFIVPTDYPSVFMMSLASARRHPFRPPSVRAEQMLHQLHELDFDWILIDLSDGISELDVGLFTLSDIPILVPSPEPAAIRLTTQFLRASVFRAIGYHPKASALEGELLDVLYNQPLTFNARNLRYDAPSADSRAIIDEALGSLEPYMIVNLVREGAEHDLGFVFSHALHRELQIFPRVLASIEYADRRWFYNRRKTGTNSSRDGDGLSNDIELLARNIRDIELVDKRYPRPIPSADDDAHPALRMGLNPELSRNEVRQYCRRLWEGYRRENAISLVFGDDDRREKIADELEQLYRHVLTMSSENFTESELRDHSTGYDESPRTGADSRESPPSPGSQTARDSGPHRSASRAPSSASSDESADPTSSKPADSDQSTDQPASDDDTEPPTSPDDDPVEPSGDPPEDSPGERLAELRRAESMSLQDLSSRTHIGVKYLAAIEQIDLEVLPRRVYLRGYLREIARVFDIDGQQLVDDYFAYLEAS